MKRKTEITFEKEETIVLRQGEKMLAAFCPRCQTLVEMATPQICALVTGLSEREVFRLIETGKIHFLETERVLVCLNCLPNFNREV